MQRFNCDCGNRQFFHNTHCLSCQREVSWCPVCNIITALDWSGENLSCARCHTKLWKCSKVIVTPVMQKLGFDHEVVEDAIEMESI